jgi:hypothetical protein
MPGDYSQLFDLALGVATDDDFVCFDVARARRDAASEVLAYERIVQSMDTAQVSTLDVAMPWLSAPRRVPEKHCDCEDADVRLSGDDLVCLHCGVIVKHLILDASKEDYGVYVCPPRRYQRTSRFRCILSRFVSGCAASLPATELALLCSDLQARKVPLLDITGVHIKQALRRLRLGVFYDDVPGILAQLTGTPRLVLSTMEMERMRHLFRAIEQSLHCTDRVYMPSYSTLISAMLAHMQVPGAARYAPALSHARTRQRVSALCAEALRKACL